MERGKRSVLIVDSSATSVFYTASLLRKLRYAVKTVSSAEDGLNVITRSAPTVVIADAVLPHMSGLDLLKQIKSHTSLRFIPVVINTADENAGTREACLQAGCAGFFVKPADPEALYLAIQTATEATPRKHIRINTSLTVRLGAGTATGPASRAETVTSLSEGGVYIATAAPDPVNSAVPLTIMLGDREITAAAVVLYSSDKAGGPHAVPGMGVKFTNISEAGVKLIREFIRASVMKDMQSRTDK